MNNNIKITNDYSNTLKKFNQKVNTFFIRLGQNQFTKTFPFILIGLLFLIIFHSNYFIDGVESNLIIHDNLDSNIVWAKTVIDQNLLFQSPLKGSEHILGNGNFATLYGYYDLNLMWFQLFGNYYGYSVAKLLQSFLAFIGLFFLIKYHFNGNKKGLLIPFFSSLMFSTLPFWSFTLSVAGIPFFLLAFLNIRKGIANKYNWLIIVLFPFVSSLFLIGFFLLLALTILFLHDVIKLKKINLKFFYALLFTSILYIISHSPLFYLYFFTDFVSHRTEHLANTVSFSNAFESAKSIFFNGQYHAHSYHYYLIPVIVLGIFIKTNLKQTYIITFIIFTSLFYGFYNWKYIHLIINHLNNWIPIQFQRFHFLHPILWHILFAISAINILNRFKTYGLVIISFIFTFQILFMWNKHETRDSNNKISYKHFYAKKTFNAVKEDIKKSTFPKSKVLAVALEPSVLKYNNFITLGGYSPNYSLNYKKSFRKIIEQELEKDTVIKKYFDNWGSRCYAFSSEVGNIILKPKVKKIESLMFNFKKIKKLKAHFLISSIEINTLKNKNLQLINDYSSIESYWHIYLYQIK